MKCALIAKPKTYTVTNAGLELPKGSMLSVSRGPVKNGNLCLFKINGLLILGRYYEGLAGRNWIIQPSRWILISTPVRILGLIA